MFYQNTYRKKAETKDGNGSKLGGNRESDPGSKPIETESRIEKVTGIKLGNSNETRIKSRDEIAIDSKIIQYKAVSDGIPSDSDLQTDDFTLIARIRRSCRIQSERVRRRPADATWPMLVVSLQVKKNVPSSMGRPQNSCLREPILLLIYAHNFRLIYAFGALTVDDRLRGDGTGAGLGVHSPRPWRRRNFSETETSARDHYPDFTLLL
ncbi:hypothetical protein EVAR_31531_1 [Eumeta japonica]|uniref:Uncharacterized protein n=1 Tax=Eumeta variegata TaxID=151549 RepID=A0A4C1Z2X0_EUMVA|nr:hypothetical protein EVAR_31531_1 [Eumeta japonica]